MPPHLHDSNPIAATLEQPKTTLPKPRLEPTSNPMTNSIWIYDTTLRDGAQREGLALSLEDKLRIAHQLDELGIPFIEGGWPGANPKDVQFFWKLQEEPLKRAEVVAFCSTRRPHAPVESDPTLQAILSAGTRWVTILGNPGIYM